MYLPQFHPSAENDSWWGRGFTEWTNVVKARPRFAGHLQPHLPADLGFYDLRLPETREAQAALAREAGVHGFCYYHYWFSGRQLLNRPFDEVLASGRPDFPFCLCWANEDWTRRWVGKKEDVLIAQDYNEADHIAHARWLCAAFADPRYIRVQGRPLFLVYRAAAIPEVRRATDLWREEARRCGLGELHLCRVESSAGEHADPRPLGFDAAVEFQPDWTRLPPRLQGLGRRTWRVWWSGERGAFLRDKVFRYEDLVRVSMAKPEPSHPCYPGVTPCWDNSARRSANAKIFHGSTPELYGRWLKAAIRLAATRTLAAPLVFINAWNEWAEGNHLEPCERWGRAYLDATRRALQDS